MRREVGNSNDLHGAKGPGSTAFTERPRPEVIQPCPVCGKQATVEVVEVTRADGRYQQTIYRCPNAARVRRTSAGRPKPRPDQHPIYRTEARIEDVPKVDEETRARYKEAVAAGNGSVLRRLEQATGIPTKSISGALAGASVSPERLEAIATAVATLDSPAMAEVASGPGLGLRSEALEAEATRPRRPYARRTATPPQGPEAPAAVASTAYQLAEQIERLVGQLLPQDPGGLLLQAAVRRGGWAGE